MYDVSLLIDCQSTLNPNISKERKFKNVLCFRSFFLSRKVWRTCYYLLGLEFLAVPILLLLFEVLFFVHCLLNNFCGEEGPPFLLFFSFVNADGNLSTKVQKHNFTEIMTVHSFIIIQNILSED